MEDKNGGFAKRTHRFLYKHKPYVDYFSAHDTLNEDYVLLSDKPFGGKEKTTVTPTPLDLPL